MARVQTSQPVVIRVSSLRLEPAAIRHSQYASSDGKASREAGCNRCKRPQAQTPFDLTGQGEGRLVPLPGPHRVPAHTATASSTHAATRRGRSHIELVNSPKPAGWKVSGSPGGSTAADMNSLGLAAADAAAESRS